MNAPVRIARDPRDAALLTAPDRVKGALTSIAHGLAELRHADDLAELIWRRWHGLRLTTRGPVSSIVSGA